MIRKSTRYLVRPVCAIISMVALCVIAWDKTVFSGLGNLFMILCMVWTISYEFTTWKSMRDRENCK